MNNTQTLNTIQHLPFSEVSELSPQALNILMTELADLKAKHDVAAAFLQTVLNHKYDFDPAYAEKGCPTGTASIDDNGFKVTMNRPKRVVWDQDALAEVEKTLISSWDANPDEYMTITRKVAEKNWNAWPTPIKKVFERARTVVAGKTTIKIEETK